MSQQDRGLQWPGGLPRASFPPGTNVSSTPPVPTSSTPPPPPASTPAPRKRGKNTGQLKPESISALALGPIGAVKSRSGWLAWLLGNGYVVSNQEAEKVDASRATLSATVNALRRTGWKIDSDTSVKSRGTIYRATLRPDGSPILATNAKPPSPPAAAKSSPTRGRPRKNPESMGAVETHTRRTRRRRGRPTINVTDVGVVELGGVVDTSGAPPSEAVAPLTDPGLDVDDIFGAVVQMLFQNGTVPVDALGALIEWRSQTEKMLAQLQ